MERFKSNARRLRQNQTSAEARLWAALRNRQLADWKFRRQDPIGRYVVDFVSFAGRLVVEVDGATHSTERELARDDQRTRFLMARGYRVVRVTNRDVYDNLEGVLETILAGLEDVRTAPSPGPAGRPLPQGER